MKKRSTLRGLPASINHKTQVLILGSFPGIQSLKRSEYYANPRNYFWRITFSLLGQHVPQDYADMINVLKKNKIGLWDVIKSCKRSRSLDNNIRNYQLNDFVKLLKKFPNIKAIFLNGRKAFDLFHANHRTIGTPYEYLPSTSPANTRQTLKSKIEQWKRLRFYITRR